ncbi:unnamed protein product [Citrullus colocynthis]|uniref:Uncharacterized protein n=1 Tax=Citrullus colocynthis TaxID=252529 RepID=A0ABP0YCB0_9ROSI
MKINWAQISKKARPNMAAFIDNKKTKLTHHLTDTFCGLSEHRSSATTGSAVFLPYHRLISSYFSTIREIFILAVIWLLRYNDSSLYW